MRSFLVPFAFACALAGRVAALTIAVGGTVGNVSATDFLAVQDTALMNECSTQCAPAMTAIQNCGTSDSCLCNGTTVPLITTCEQCMFNQLITDNRPMPDPRAGSTSALTAYAAACLASVNVTVPKTSITLTLPSNWDGPVGVGLNLAGTVVTVAAGFGLGMGSLLLLSNM
ncbi:hypothetical protein NEOLEDRAFT_1125590 [Neolentinus lepideus HHB14362 ss-1]|uniref:Extracellular membrane protein CFEM domain-containing protein n=1 Tax=Neolentinus lepideus HHB14362 ss-1 TaxID=1314782 RepID=A0A165MF49_9AGAM|nr:hypothetical protein NEOLEDRAFT_1125590 [Neolentinus lepideus HHB14362 ss-1]